MENKDRKRMVDPETGINGFWYRYEHAAVTTDNVIFGFDGKKINILLVRRGIEPYKDHWALPGGFMKMNETATEGAKRELEEETGLKDAYIRQFHTFTKPGRDPRERVITIAYYALVRMQEVKGGDDAAEARWFDIDNLPSLAFDHDKILREAQRELRKQIHFEPIGFELLPEEFTMKSLQQLYEAILDIHFDRRNFHKKMIHLGILNQVESKTDKKSVGRDAFLYTFNKECYDEMKQKGFRLEF